MARKTVIKTTPLEETSSSLLSSTPETTAGGAAPAKRHLFGKTAAPVTPPHEAFLETVHSVKEKSIEAANLLTADIETTFKKMEVARDAHENAMAQSKEAWRRETEQYEYERTMNRTKEDDDYRRRKEIDETDWKAQRVQREQALLEKENMMRAREAEIRDLEKQAREFPQVLEKTVENAVADKESAMRESARVAAELTAKDREREDEIAKLRIQNLEDALKRQSTHIASLEKQLQQAVERAQSLAVTIVEGGSKRLETDARPPQTPTQRTTGV